MASLAMEIGDDDDYLQLSPVEEDGEDYLQLPPVEEYGDDYLQLPPVDEDGEDNLHLPPEQHEEEDHLFGNALHHTLRSYSLADIIPRVGVAGAPDDSEVALAVAEALKTVETPSEDDGRDCPICLQGDGTAAWKETPCGHRFHGRCVETWLQAKGSCPMCRHKVVEMPTADATITAVYQNLVRSVIFEAYGQDGVNSAFMEEQ